MTKTTDLKRGLTALREAVEWAGDRTLAAAWGECHRADWMLWMYGMMAGKPGWPTRPQVVLAACLCAQRALKYVPAGEDRPRLAIEAARAWAANPSAEAAWAAWAAAEAAWAAGAAGAAAMVKPNATRDAHRKRVRRSRKPACENCGSSSKLQIHHKDLNWSNDTPENLQTLCATCHMTLHWAAGTPAHPLYLPAGLKPIPFNYVR